MERGARRPLPLLSRIHPLEISPSRLWPLYTFQVLLSLPAQHVRKNRLWYRWIRMELINNGSWERLLVQTRARDVGRALWKPQPPDPRVCRVPRGSNIGGVHSVVNETLLTSRASSSSTCRDATLEHLSCSQFLDPRSRGGESSLPVAHPGYQVLSDILFRLGLIANVLTQCSA